MGQAKYYVTGPAVDPSSVDVDALILRMYHNDQKVYEGPATEVLGSPWKVMLWLANDLHTRETPLKEGDVVLTGKVAAAYKCAPDRAKGTYVGEGGPLGTIRCVVE